MQINFGSRSVSCKIVYYGPGLSGKTTNIEKIHELMPSDRKGELTSIKTDGDRTLFFDFMSLDLGRVAGMDTRFQIYTVPGQVYYNATRKLVLQGADGIVFVADSGPHCMQDNIESWKNLQENLAERNLSITELPLVIQWNKRDLPDALSVEDMNRNINTIGAPTFEAVACRGEGVVNTLKAVCGLVCKTLGAKQAGDTASREAGRVQAPAAVVEQARTADVEEMRFVSRRRAAAASAAPVAATVVTERPAPPRPPRKTRTTPTTVSTVDEAPAPPMPKRQRMPMRAGPPEKPRRLSWGPVLMAAGVLAACAGVAAVLHVLGIW